MPFRAFFATIQALRSPGGLPERPMGADCKSAGNAFEGSNPSPATINIGDLDNIIGLDFHDKFRNEQFDKNWNCRVNWAERL